MIHEWDPASLPCKCQWMPSHTVTYHCSPGSTANAPPPLPPPLIPPPPPPHRHRHRHHHHNHHRHRSESKEKGYTVQNRTTYLGCESSPPEKLRSGCVAFIKIYSTPIATYSLVLCHGEGFSFYLPRYRVQPHFSPEDRSLNLRYIASLPGPSCLHGLGACRGIPRGGDLCIVRRSQDKGRNRAGRCFYRSHTCAR